MPHTPVSTVRTVSIKLLVPLWLFTVSFPATATDQSRYADQLDSTSYPSINVRSEPVDMRWNFSRGERYNYDYTQQGTLIFKVRGFPGDGPAMMSQKLDAGGSVNLESLFNNKARLRVKLDAEIDAILPGGERQTLSESMPPYVIEDYSDRGIYQPRNPDLDFAIHSLMSLP
ncbi:MAG: hypothetical protein R3318_02140, partial [Gammaproteobacteria bacterium]|nr:hypothetical protein [Gammaproteobacteria bacterium]